MTDPRDWIGRSQTSADVITQQPVAFLHNTLGKRGDAPGEGAPLPPAWHWLYFLHCDNAGEIGRDGHAMRGGFLPPIHNLPRRMWAGSRFEFIEPILIGDAITKTSEISAVMEKTGRAGPMCFVTVSHRLTRGDTLCIHEEHDIVYLKDRMPGEAIPAPPVEMEAEVVETVSPDPVLLFRYSALTMNSHRIHYDLDYCRDVEGYPGLVVHGPLLATMLLDLAVRQGEGRPIKSFSFRAVSPLFHIADFTLSARRDSNALQLWAANDEGGLAMQSTAELG